MMGSSGRGRLLGWAAVAFLFMLAAPARAQDAPLALTCADTAALIDLGKGESMRVACPASCGREAAYGTDVYTDQSSICTAALHAGALGPAGGVAVLTLWPGAESYIGSDRNGITSETWPQATVRAFSMEAVPPAIVAVAVAPVALEFDCAETAVGLELEEGDTARASCPAGCAPGPVWGIGPYSDDSVVCTAAVHAGVTGPEGSVFTLTMLGEQLSYAASTDNGITTSAWDRPYGPSFILGRTGIAAPPTTTPAPVVAAPTVTPEPAAPPTSEPPTAEPPAAGEVQAIACSRNAVVFEGAAGASFTLACPADCNTMSAWGTDFYTDDSTICTAALHMGLIGPEGGEFLLIFADGLDKYVGSERNGVTTFDYGPWHRAYTLAPLPGAAAAPEPEPAAAAFTLPPLTFSISMATADGEFTGLAPDGWYTDMSEMPLLATSAAAADAAMAGPAGDYPPGSIVIQAALPGALREAFGANPTGSREEIIAYIASIMGVTSALDMVELDGLDQPHVYAALGEGAFTPPGVFSGALAADYDGTIVVYLMAYNTSEAEANAALTAVVNASSFAAK